MSGIMDFLGGAGAASESISGGSILLQAVGAAMRGESAQTFMKRLANQHPQLKKMNLDDLQGTAQQLCQQKGINPDDLAKKLDGVIDPMIQK
jgi:hypothetical protein